MADEATGGGGTPTPPETPVAAPADAAPVVFHVAGNAADGDMSQFGDHVYARGFVRAGRQ